MVKQNKETKKNDADALKARIKELDNNWKRAVADYQNLKKRNEKEKAEFAKYANMRILSRLLPVSDALEKAVVNSGGGVRLIQKQINEIFKSEGVEKIEVKQGDKFNPELMEAVETKKNLDKRQKNRIAGIIRNGFKYKDRILRPVEVQVNI